MVRLPLFPPSCVKRTISRPLAEPSAHDLLLHAWNQLQPRLTIESYCRHSATLSGTPIDLTGSTAAVDYYRHSHRTIGTALRLKK